MMVLVPMPSILAPSATRKCARSCTWGSEAALRRWVVPWAATAATSAFSVAVTLGSSRKTSAPLRRAALNSSWCVAVTVAPNCSKARKCVSRRLRPITSPPGGGSATSPQRASSGAASRIEARMRAQSSGSRSAARISLAWIKSVLRACHSAVAPTERTSSTSVSVSRIRGTLSSVTGCSVSSAAAMIGSAAFLLPDGSMVPERRWPPSTIYWMGGTAFPYALHIDIGAQRIILNEFPPWFNHIAHQLGEDVVGLVDFLDPDLQQRALVGVERGFPELARVHLAEAFVALKRHPLGPGIGHRLEQPNRAVDRGLGVLAPQQAGAGIGLLQLGGVFVELARVG